jgi:preprotein translocase subunit SecE
VCYDIEVLSESPQQGVLESFKNHSNAMSVITRFINYINGSRQELKKVVWPSRKEITQHTVMVVVVSLAIALFLGVVIDFTLTAILEIII